MMRLISLLLLSISLFGQSAYYRLGYGDLYPTTTTSEASLGQGIVAWKDSTRIPSYNPAAATNLNRVFFNVSLGSEFKSIDALVSNNTRVEHISFAVPLGGNFGLNLGVNAIGDFKTNYHVSTDDGIIDENSSGGMWDYSLGAGYTLNPNISLGVKFHLLHGFLRRQTAIQTSTADELYVIKGSISGKSIELGAITNIGDKVTLGLTADIPYVTPMLTGEDSLAGTLSHADLEEELSAWPTTIKLGVVYQHSKRTKIISGIGQQMFPESGFQNAAIFKLPEGWNTVPVASFQIAMQRTPFDRTSRNWIRRTGWNAGVSVKNYYLTSSDKRYIYEYAFISGINLGMRNGRSIFDISGEFGSRGGDASLPEELFARVKFGIQVNDIWFRKVKRR